MESYIAESAQIINCQYPDSVKVFKDSRLKESVLHGKNIIGDHTRVDYSQLKEYVRIDRLNHLYYVNIGRHSYTGQDTVIMHSEIGAFCSIAWDVSIGPANHDYHKITNHSFLYNAYDKIRPEESIAYDRFNNVCKVGNDVWIGSGATILRNVKIGDGAIVGGGAVVTKDVPPYAIVAGIPAKIIRFRFDQKLIKELLELRWWNFSDELIKELYPFFAEDLEMNMIKKIKEKVLDFENRKK